ncbi:elongator complex protein 5 [Plodia interpunctella]|uniref:elongator complex protein 5 n=1 Tax=Plodia interpunctella TaxID=58824 RepID=UPI002368107E|nr:elongator complex protein 5 [Plodia interpunctella]
MTLFKLKSAPTLLIEDDNNKNILPLLLDVVQQEKSALKIFCFEQPVSLWRKVLQNHSSVTFHKELCCDQYNNIINTKSVIVIDSINQMCLHLGWNECLKCLKRLCSDAKVHKLVMVLHLDCLPFPKLQLHLNHIANAIVSYDLHENNKIRLKLKKGGKMVRSEEILSYDSKLGLLRCTPVVKETSKDDEPVKPLPANLSTFKIEVDQTEKLEKYKLKLPYMSKINEGESKVFYEPDAVDDWDEEDPDEDLDI